MVDAARRERPALSMNPLLSIALGLALAVLPPNTESVREPESKVVFPVRIDAAGSKQVRHELIGTGIKTKTIFKFDQYAIGLYIDVDEAIGSLAAWDGKTIRRLRKDKLFYKALTRGDFSKTLRIVMVRDIGIDNWLDSLEERILPRLERYDHDLGMQGGRAGWQRVREFFTMKKLHEGNELLFTAYGDGRLVVSLRGTLRGETLSKPLCWAILDCFLWTDPLSESAKKTLISRVPMVIERELAKQDD